MKRKRQSVNVTAPSNRARPSKAERWGTRAAHLAHARSKAKRKVRRFRPWSHKTWDPFHWPFDEGFWGWRVVAFLGLGRRAMVVFTVFAGVALGVLSAMAGEVFGGASSAQAAVRHAVALDLRDAPDIGFAVASPLSGSDIERRASAAPFTIETAGRLSPGPVPSADKPRIVIIIDDLGLNRPATRQVTALPGPLTLSFLPYADNLQPLVDAGVAAGHEPMLHLPMEPSGAADAGPWALTHDMSASELRDTLNWHLQRFTGYTAINNHMGSRLTSDLEAMQVVLAEIAAHDLYFVDSVTTSASVVSVAGAHAGAEVYARDLFLDAEPGEEAVARQLRRLEAIARKTGLAVAIGHPREATIRVLGPWLTTAEARGFELETVEALRRQSPYRRQPPAIVAVSVPTPTRQ